MVRESVTLNDVLEYLNTLREVDPQLMGDFVNNRFEMRKPLTEYPDGVQPFLADKKYVVGLIGLLNGLFGAYDEPPLEGYGPITVIVSQKNVYDVQSFVSTAAHRATLALKPTT